MAKLTTALLSVLAMAPYSYAGNLIVKNQCPTTIWCGAAKNDGTFSPSVQVAPGASYTSPKPAYNDGIGAVLKCGQEQDMLHPYQLEMAVQNGRSWLDLSNLDGSPYHGFHRHAEIAGSNCVLDCPPWSTACEWPYQVDCWTEADVTMTLC